MEVAASASDYYARIEFPVIVRAAMEANCITQGEMADELGIDRVSLTDRLSYRVRFSLAEALYLSHRFNIKFPPLGE